MMLLDHFHPPLSKHRHWHSFHNAWATYLAADLNHRLPEGYFAEPNVQFGIEIDIAAFKAEDSLQLAQLCNTPCPAWPPQPDCAVPFEPASEVVEVNIFESEDGPKLTGVIELVSPANKDREAHRKAFVSKCEAYLQRGLGLVIVDLVTGRMANLHNELLARISPASSVKMEASLYSAAYRVVKHDGRSCVDIWPHVLAVGQPLPTMPLWLRGDICLPVDLQATYEVTCREQRIVDSIA